jgi:SAM-dependent methyltransferase
MTSDPTSQTPDSDHWARIAEDWITWVRTPDHDAFWAYRSALAEFIGSGSGDALDVGCGEGRGARLLTELGYRVTAADPVDRFLEAARELDSAETYVRAPAGALPFADGRFDLVMAYNVLMDLDDVPGALAEMARVLKPSGRLILSVVHPIVEQGDFDGREATAGLVMQGSYFGRRRFEDKVSRAGLNMHFAGWSLPLEGYFAALEAAGLAVRTLREPKPELTADRAHLNIWGRFPLFLWMTARKA